MTAVAASRAFVVWFRDLDRWNVGSYVATGWRWPKDAIRPLADALTRKVAEVDRKTTRPEAVRLVTLHFDGEMEPRNATTRPVKGRLFWAEPGDVTYSKIDVRNGAIGIVPSEMGRVCVTTEYPVYAVNPNVADARYIKLLFRTAVFRKKINGMISGASGRKRVQPDDLEQLEVPLPALNVQAAIIAAWEAAQRELAATRTKIAELEERIEADFLADLGLSKPARATLPKCFAVRWKDLLDRWGVDVNREALVRLDPADGKYPVVHLADAIADLENGWSPKCLDHPAEADEWGVLKMGAVSFGTYNERDNKALPAKLKPRPTLEVQPGDFLISRANITRLVGACAFVRQTRPRLMLCDKIFRAVWRSPSPIEPRYLDEVLKIPHVRRQIENSVTGTSATMKNITKPALLALRFPLPPPVVQKALVAKLDARRAEIAALRTAAAEREQRAKADVEAMILGTKPIGAE